MPNISNLRKTIGSYLGQVLTPEMAAEIELSASAVQLNDEQTIALLNKWQYLIEPTIQSSITPMSWNEAITTPVNVMESANSVLVILPACIVNGKRVVTIWVAAGVMREVLELFDALVIQAKAAGVQEVRYVGRDGWLKVAGFTKIAVFGVKEI